MKNQIRTLVFSLLTIACTSTFAYTGDCNKSFGRTFESVPLGEGKISLLCPGGGDEVKATEPVRVDDAECWVADVGATAYNGEPQDCDLTIEVTYTKPFSAPDTGCQIQSYKVVKSSRSCYEVFERFEKQQGLSEN